MSTYQLAMGRFGDAQNETFIVSVSIYDHVPEFYVPEGFLDFVKLTRAAEPKTGRFEIIRNEERLYPERSEICVKHETAAKDFGAKRGNEYTVIEYYGMNCKHPMNPSVGIFIELSRKAPPGVDFPQFRSLGEQLLKSVRFETFR